ncbi:MAG TPA: nucleotidyltransferase family protein [Saprospiraceae bacterium]|nr:nucleotidyltransferase family protein [Saprospiraceae bacterium]
MSNHGATHVVLILAAGESRRYGSAKQLAVIEGEPMIRRVVRNLLDPDKYELVVILGAREELIRPTIADLEVEIVLNMDWKSGIALSIQAGASHVKSKYPQARGIVIVLGDQWRIRKEHIKELIAQAEASHSIVAMNYDGCAGVPVYFPKDTWSLFSLLQGDEGAKKILESMEDVILIDIPEAKIDLDFPE